VPRGLTINTGKGKAPRILQICPKVRLLVPLFRVFLCAYWLIIWVTVKAKNCLVNDPHSTGVELRPFMEQWPYFILQHATNVQNIFKNTLQKYVLWIGSGTSSCSISGQLEIFQALTLLIALISRAALCSQQAP